MSTADEAKTVWESAVRNTLVRCLALFVGWETAAWFGSRLAPAYTYITFLAATLFGATMLGVYLLIVRMKRPATPAGGQATVPATQSLGPQPKAGPSTRSNLFPELPKDEIPEGSLFLVINHELPESPGLPTKPLFQNLKLSQSFKLLPLLSSESWAYLLSVRSRSDQPEFGRILVEMVDSADAMPARLKALRAATEVAWWRNVIKLLISKSPPYPKLRGVVLLSPIDRLLGDGSTNLADQLSLEFRLLGSLFHARFPVYFVLTEARRVPYFMEFTENLRADEREDPIGILLSDVEASRVDADHLIQQFEDWYHRLADKRLTLLNREKTRLIEDKARVSKPAIYEHPREWSKLAPHIAAFLERVMRPLRQGACGPVLRGIYITGKAARPIAGTVVWAPGRSLPVTEDNLFLSGLVTKVLAADENRAYFPASASGFSLPGAVLGVVIGLFVLLLSGSAYSFILNRRLLASAHDVIAANTQPIQQLTPVTTRQELANMDQLRQLLDDIDHGQYRKQWEMRWGLYEGDDVNATARNLYFRRLKTVLVDPVRAALNQQLSDLSPSRQTMAFESVRDRLRLYRTIHRRECTPDQSLVAATMNAIWTELPTRNDQSDQLAAKQIDFYARELVVRDPYSLEPITGVVDTARQYLQGIRGPEQVYAGIKEEANRTRKAVRLPDVLASMSDRARLESEHRKLLKGPIAVEAAFAAANFPQILSSINNWNSGGTTDSCSGVSSTATLQNASPSAVAETIRSKYIEDYHNQWKKFLADTHVVKFNDRSAAVTRLEELTQNQSPLLGVLAFVGDNTGNVQLAPQFRPVHYIVPPGSRDSWRNANNDLYFEKLRSLTNAMREVERRPTDQSARQAAQRAVDEANGAVNRLKDGFGNGTGEIGNEVERLLREPISYCGPFIQDEDPAVVAKQARQTLCSQWRPLQHKFPFDSKSADTASDEDVNKIFDPRRGSLWSFERQGLLVRKEGKWIKGPAAANLTFEDPFLRFLNRVAEIYDFVFGEPKPNIKVLVTPLYGDTVEVNFRDPELQGGVRVALETGTAKYPGRWGVYEMEAKADRSKAGSVVLRDLKGNFEVKIKDLRISPALPKLGGLDCPATVVAR